MTRIVVIKVVIKLSVRSEISLNNPFIHIAIARVQIGVDRL